MSGALDQQILEHVVDLVEKLAGLTAEVRGINVRLDKLNGSSARHEKAITELRAAAANDEKRGTSARDTWKTVAAVGGVAVALASAVFNFLS